MGRKSVRNKKQLRGCLGRFLLFLVVVEGLILAAGIGAFVYVNSVLDLVERPQVKNAAILKSWRTWVKACPERKTTAL